MLIGLYVRQVVAPQYLLIGLVEKAHEYLIWIHIVQQRVVKMRLQDLNSIPCQKCYDIVS